MILGLGLPLTAARPAPAAAPPTGTLALAPLSRDRVLFDSGAAVGLNAATVPLAGTGTAGRIVQLRARSVDDGDTTGTVWADAATVAANGAWQAALTLARSASWYVVEARLKDEPQVMVQGAQRLGVGHVIAVWGQSEHARIWSAFYNQTPPAALLNEDCVQMMWYDAGIQHRHLTTAAPHTAACAAMANALMAARPGEKFAVVHHTQPGTDPRALVNDADPSRPWANDLALHQFATADGQKVGMATWSWFAAPGSLAGEYGAALFPLFSGRRLDGTVLTFPTLIAHGSGSYQADHWFGELYDYARMRWIPYGPHRFDIAEDMQSATVRSAGGLNISLANKQTARDSWRAMLASPHATMFAPPGHEPLNYANGVPDGAGGWTDMPHPRADSEDGLCAFARSTAQAALQGAGLAPWPVPRFDACTWASNGAHVEVWSSAGPVTTTRLARGEPPLPVTFPHWTQVWGFQINGAPALHTQILAGRVRVLPNAAAFVPGDTLTFGEGGASGALAFPEDLVAQSWKDMPIVATGVAGMTGTSVSPMPQASVMANTLQGPQLFTVSTAGPYFVDPVTIGANTGRLFVAARVNVPAITAAAVLASLSATMVRIEVMPSGALRLNVRDSANTNLVGGVTGGVLTFGSFATVLLSVDLVARQARVWLNGALVIDAALAANTGSFATTRILSALALNTGATQLPATVEYIRFWKEASGSGTPPVATPYKALTGPAATANADAWKMPAGVAAT